MNQTNAEKALTDHLKAIANRAALMQKLNDHYTAVSQPLQARDAAIAEKASRTKMLAERIAAGDATASDPLLAQIERRIIDAAAQAEAAELALTAIHQQVRDAQADIAALRAKTPGLFQAVQHERLAAERTAFDRYAEALRGCAIRLYGLAHSSDSVMGHGAQLNAGSGGLGSLVIPVPRISAFEGAGYWDLTSEGQALSRAMLREVGLS